MESEAYRPQLKQPKKYFAVTASKQQNIRCATRAQADKQYNHKDFFHETNVPYAISNEGLGASEGC